MAPIGWLSPGAISSWRLMVLGSSLLSCAVLPASLPVFLGSRRGQASSYVSRYATFLSQVSSWKPCPALSNVVRIRSIKITKRLTTRRAVSTDDVNHSSVTMSPDGREIYWAMGPLDHPRRIYVSEWMSGGWSKPEIVSFTEDFDGDCPVNLTRRTEPVF